MQKDFCLGSEWLYYKIYTGVRTADYILLEKLNPVISDLEERKIIQKWFFIRYKDTEEHIRIRFLVNNTKDLLTIIESFYPVFNNLIEENLIWKIQTDTYKRELERYGEKTIIESESLFWHDSKMILQYLELKSSFGIQELPLLFSFYTIDTFLNLFQLSNNRKLLLLSELQVSFNKEFEIDKEQKKEIDRNYRLLEPQIQSILSGSFNTDFNEITDVVTYKSKQIKKTVLTVRERIEISTNSFLASHIHMMINRQYSSKQRMYELIIYNHLYRYYKVLHYKNKFSPVI
jgi:thiopeptide-type bacteriocin biosynthesis protein